MPVGWQQPAPELQAPSPEGSWPRRRAGDPFPPAPWVKAPHGAEPSGTGSFLRVESGNGCRFIQQPRRGGRDCSARHHGGTRRRSGKGLRVDFALKGPALAARGIDRSVIYVPGQRHQDAELNERPKLTRAGALDQLDK